MGASGSRKIQNIIPKNINQIAKSICKMTTSDNILGFGFLIKFYKRKENFFCLMSCEHIIKKELINQKEKISFYYDNESKKKEIILDTNERFIKDFRDIDIDVTIVEIIKSDNISEGYFLLPNIDYMNNLSKLNNKSIHIPQFSDGGNISCAEGTIIKANKYELNFKCNKKNISSGNPLLLKDMTRIIGIQKQMNNETKEFIAYSIEPIFNFIKNGFNYQLKNEDEENDEEIEKFIKEKEKDEINKKLKEKYGKKIKELIDDSLDENSKLHNYISYSENDNDNDFPLTKLHNYFLSEKDVPCILKIHSDNGLVEFKDKEDKYHLLTLEEFFKLIKNKPEKNKCFCHPNPINTLATIYCIKCKNYICSDCLLSYNHSEYHIKSCIRLNKVGNTCLTHELENSISCESCEKTVCDECFDEFHKFHKKEDIDENKIKKAKKEIADKNQKLLKLKEFYEMIRLAYESDPENPIYRKNMINVGNSAKMEKSRDKYDKDLKHSNFSKS